MTGCINQRTFEDDETVVKLNAYKANIPVLKEDSITDLLNVERMIFLSCNINEIEPGAFKRLPKLISLSIFSNSINELVDDTFNGLNVETLNVANNDIRIIRSATFRNMLNLKYLYAFGNLISQYNSDWFKESPNLSRITMSNNNLRLLPRKAFYFNKKLLIIELSNNNIDTIEEDAFDGVTSLQLLALDNNLITVLDDRSFLSNISIKNFLINKNKLNYVTNKLFKKIILNEISFYGNPWNCKCLNEIENFFYRNNVKIITTSRVYCSNLPICVDYEYKSNLTKCTENYDNDSVQYFFEQIANMRKSKECFRHN